MGSFDGGKSVHSARRVAQRDVVHRASGATTSMGRFSATLERTIVLKFRDEWAGRFCPLTALASACGGMAPRRETRLVRDQNRLGQMIPDEQETLYLSVAPRPAEEVSFDGLDLYDLEGRPNSRDRAAARATASKTGWRIPLSSSMRTSSAAAVVPPGDVT